MIPSVATPEGADPGLESPPELDVVNLASFVKVIPLKPRYCDKVIAGPPNGLLVVTLLTRLPATGLPVIVIRGNRGGRGFPLLATAETVSSFAGLCALYAS